ncbi:GMC oxidoreductase [Mycena sanguinolenta]|uniref:GMC oxidoreductase n=1 Tax=Mycena sanguinolenta TaxID=230812 RepID=A0A8H6ZGC7_9AGAR|nr:GMC oxidoreductase [Mycena sanguinolenta]
MECPSVLEIEAFIGTPFDYIVVGGGTTGLPIANRLSEDSDVKVGILEAGVLFENDPLIDVPRNLAMNNGNPKYDWVSSTSPQAGAAGRSMPVIRGKMLGGSSALNYMAWDRGSREEYDAWELFSDVEGGWNWDSLLPSFTKTEDKELDPANRDLAIDFSDSKADVVSPGIPIEVAIGTGGPVKICHNMGHTDVIPPYVKAWNTLGQSTNANPFGGHAVGLYNCPVGVDYKTGKRITATSAYYTPASSRANLKLLTGAQVTKIVFNSELIADKRVAVGVEFTVHGKSYSVSAAKEIILSAGTIETPKILELSGVGDAKRLKDMGIQTIVDLPGVGENLHDHTFTHVHYQATLGIRTFDELSKDPEFAAAEQERYDKTGQGWMASNDTIVVFTPLNKITEESILSAKIKEVEADIAVKKSKGLLNELAIHQYSTQLDWLKRGRLPHMEFVLFSRGLVKPDPDGSYFIITTGLQHPFSRGSVHIQSADPLQQPSINPCYLTAEFGYRAIEKLAQTPPLADIIAKQVMPATHLTDEEIYSLNLYRNHYMGTAAMARRELGGVVGNNLKVHGTANLRVTDASIVPVPVAAHIQATVYAIGETAASLIKSEHNY